MEVNSHKENLEQKPAYENEMLNLIEEQKERNRCLSDISNILQKIDTETLKAELCRLTQKYETTTGTCTKCQHKGLCASIQRERQIRVNAGWVKNCDRFVEVPEPELIAWKRIKEVK